ncbi:MAG: CDP-archaeol synthase [Gammaproteobacteria bacterium]|nr:CDP-archaeol synthase [Gammaproteobacteria bacterium]
MKEIAEVLLLILVANGSPVIVSFLFSHRLSLPVDFGLKLKDQQYLFGKTKTWRGLIMSLALTASVSVLLDGEYYIGLLISLLAMTGDLFSSFIKRRLKKASSSEMLLLDQLPESVLPAVMMMSVIPLNLTQVIAIVIAFYIIERMVSKMLFKIGIRKRPY